MSKAWTHYKLTPTRYQLSAQHKLGEKIADECNLFYGNQPNVGWRFVVQNDGYRQVGPIYRTKAELLADLSRYASTWSKEWA